METPNNNSHQTVSCSQCGGYKPLSIHSLCNPCIKKNHLDDLLTDPPVWHKALFNKFLESYGEIEEMGVDPIQLLNRWRTIRLEEWKSLSVESNHLTEEDKKWLQQQ